MAWFASRARRETDSLLNRWSAEIAQRCAQPLLQDVADQVSRMSVYELRGYLRARALLLVDRQLTQVLAEASELAVSEEDTLFQGSLQRLVELVERHLTNTPWQYRARRQAA